MVQSRNKPRRPIGLLVGEFNLRLGSDIERAERTGDFIGVREEPINADWRGARDRAGDPGRECDLFGSACGPHLYFFS